MPKVTRIPPKRSVRSIAAAEVAEPVKRKVCGYARVSTDHDDQENSYNAQVDYYTNYIKSHADWEFVGIYTDEGISGTSTKRREGFKKMVADALAGKVSLIITKSASRFARNTVDSLSTIRKLKEHGVEVYFEKENIWTFDGKGELLITIMSSLAQEESRSISENTTWGQRKRFADGKVCVPFKRFLGYDRGPNGELVVNREQAKTVKLIYGLFLEGYTPHSIAVELTKRGLKTPGGKDLWSRSTVLSILSNEKYKGDAILQKTYCTDFLTKKFVKNDGSEIPKYYVQDDHEAIISADVFDEVQTEIERRKQGKGRYSGVGIFSSKLKCGECGGWYGAKVWHSTDKYRRVVYQCNNKFKGENKCGTPHLTEEEIKTAFVKAVNRLVAERDEVIATIEAIRHKLGDTSELELQKKEQMGEMEVVAGLIEEWIHENARVAMNQETYNERYNALDTRYRAAETKVAEIVAEIKKLKDRDQTLQRFINALRDTGPVTAFDEGMWGHLVDYVTVHNKGDMTFTFKDGTEIKV